MSVNKVILIGRLGRDPDMKTTQGGLAIASLNLATTERKKDADGNWGEHTEWHRVSAFGKTAENAGRFLSKGRQVYVDGRLRTRKYTDKDGVERWSTEVIADTLTFLGSRGEDAGGSGNAGSGGGGRYQKGAPAPAPAPASSGGVYEDDGIPF